MLRMIRASVMAVLVACWWVPAVGAEELSISEAVNRALAYSPMLKAMQASEGAAREKVGEARSMKGVRVNLAVEEARLDSPMMAFGARLNQGRIAQSDFDPRRLNDPSAINNLRLGAQVALPLHLGGMDRHAAAAAREGVKAAGQATERTREEIIFRTIEAYLGVMLARESVAVAEKALESSAESLRNASAAYNAQRVVYSDLLQAQVHHTGNEETLLRQRNQLRLAQEVLATMMGVPSAQEANLTMPFLQQACIACGEDPQVLLEQALAQRPDYLGLARQVEALGHQERMVRGMVRPHVVVGAAAEQNREDLDGGGKGNSMVFARVDWNVADGGESRHKARGLQQETAGLRDRLGAMKDQIFLEIRSAVTTINNALERIRVSASAVEQSQESLRILRDRYSSGLAIMSDILGAETSLSTHRMNHVQALYDYALSKARLKMALGELTPEHCEILQAGH